MTIVILLVIEITSGIKEEGFVKNIIEMAAAIILVVVLSVCAKSCASDKLPS